MAAFFHRLGELPDDSRSMPSIEAQNAFDLMRQRFPGNSANADEATARVVFVAAEGERVTDVDNRAIIERLVNPSLSTTRVLILTTFETDEYVAHALRAGASGFLGKDVSADALLDGIRTVASGDGSCHPRPPAPSSPDSSPPRNRTRPPHPSSNSPPSPRGTAKS